VKSKRTIFHNLIATILVAMSFPCSAFASANPTGPAEFSLPSQSDQRQSIQINLSIDKATPTPHGTATAEMGVRGLALQGQTVPRARCR